MHVRKGDAVVVVAGKEKGKRGRVLRLLTKKGRVVVDRVNLVKRHTRPTQQGGKGGIIEKEGSVPLSNVMLWCQKCGRGRRHRNAVRPEHPKRRVCVKCASVFEVA